MNNIFVAPIKMLGKCSGPCACPAWVAKVVPDLADKKVGEPPDVHEEHRSLADCETTEGFVVDDLAPSDSSSFSLVKNIPNSSDALTAEVFAAGGECNGSKRD